MAPWLAIAWAACGPLGVGTVPLFAAAPDRAVVPLLFQGRPVCSGTVIARRVVLTAAHCLRWPQLRVRLGPRLERTPAYLLAHPGFDPGGPSDDVGLILLAEPAPVPPASLPAAAAAGPPSGRRLRIFGYRHGERLVAGHAVVSHADATTVSLAPGPEIPTAGDSGGAAFLDLGGEAVLAAVHSSGDGRSWARGMRVAAYLESFIVPFVGSTAEGAAGVGERCFYPRHCAEGSCVPPTEPPAFPYCSRPCRVVGDCPIGMACSPTEGGASCRYPSSGPGAPGFPCGADGDCATGSCLRWTATSGVCRPPGPRPHGDRRGAWPSSTNATMSSDSASRVGW